MAPTPRPSVPLHELDSSLLAQLHAWLTERLSYPETPLDAEGDADSNAKLAREAVAETITVDGIGTTEAFRVFTEEISPLVMSTDSPRFWSFIPAAPSPSAMLMDAAVGASSMQACSWFEAAGPVAAEEKAAKYLCEVAGLPSTSGGVFVSGGSAANLSALTVARDKARADGGRGKAVLVATSAHTSIGRAAHVLDLEVHSVECPEGKLLASDLEAKISSMSAEELSEVCAIAVTAGTTNTGLVDDLEAAAKAAQKHGWWLHVDAAYGGAGLLDERKKDLFRGIEQADSITMDPHKWWFVGYDCAALLYARPLEAAAVHTQDAAYLDALHNEDSLVNPSDMAYHLTRRARGLSLWFALAAHGTRSFEEAVASSIDQALWFAQKVRERDDLELVMEPELSIVLFRKDGWGPEQWWAWADKARKSGLGLALPTKHNEEVVGRVVLLHPNTTNEMLEALLDSIP